MFNTLVSAMHGMLSENPFGMEETRAGCNVIPSSFPAACLQHYLAGLLPPRQDPDLKNNAATADVHLIDSLTWIAMHRAAHSVANLTRYIVGLHEASRLHADKCLQVLRYKHSTRSYND